MTEQVGNVLSPQDLERIINAVPKQSYGIAYPVKICFFHQCIHWRWSVFFDFSLDINGPYEPLD